MKIKDIIWMAIVCTIFVSMTHHYRNYREARGVAISEYLAAYQALDVPPYQAAYLDITLNNVDLEIGHVSMFLP